MNPTCGGTTRLRLADYPPFRNGHVRRPHPCVTCGRPTRRTVPQPGRVRGETSRYVLCSRCELPGAEERLLMAVLNVATLPELATGYERYVAGARERYEDLTAHILVSRLDQEAER